MCGLTAAERRSDSRAIREVRGRRSRLSGITLARHGRRSVYRCANSSISITDAVSQGYS
jgi:hypothetical protein